MDTYNDNDVSDKNDLTEFLTADGDFLRLAEAWPTLPAAIKRGILAMVD